MNKYNIIGLILIICSCNFANASTNTLTLKSKTATIFLRQPLDHYYKLEQKVNDISDPDSQNYGKYLNVDELIEFVRIDEGRYVKQYLDDNNMNYYDFGDGFEVYYDEKSDHHTLLKNMMNSNIGHHIMHVEGIVSMNVKQTRLHNLRGKSIYDSAPVPDSGYVGREVLTRLYNISMNDAIKNNISLALVEFDDGGFFQSDLNMSMLYNGVTPTYPVYVVGENDEDGTESSLDMQMSAIVAKNVHQWYLNYHQSQWIAGMAANISAMKNPPMIASVSYGWSQINQCYIVSCDNITSQQYVELSETQLAKMALRGVSTIVSSGDAGSLSRSDEDCSSDNVIQADYPGSSSFVTSVGATFVNANTSKLIGKDMSKTKLCANYPCATGTELSTVNYEYVGWTTGSCFGEYTNQGAWQQDLVTKYLMSDVYLPKNPFNGNGRATPDVVTVGHNAPVFMSGSLTSVDGTSMSAPIFAGLVAMWNDNRLKHNGTQLGFLNPFLYKIAQQDGKTFNNSFVGNSYCSEYTCCGQNDGFQTSNDPLVWQSVSGLGTPNFGRINQYV